MASILGLSWNLGVLGIALSPLFVLLWRRASNRGEAAGLAVGYHLAGALPVLQAISATGYDTWGPFELAGLAAVGAGTLAATWAAFWAPACREPGWQSIVRVAGVLSVTALPGLGVIGLQSPLTAAGVYFPATGWAGLIGIVLVTSLLPHRPSARTVIVLALVGCLQLQAASARASSYALRGRSSIAARITELAVPAVLHDYFGQGQVALDVQASLNESPEADIVVLPEGIAGLWTEEMRALWQRRPRAEAAQQELVVLGATRPVETAAGELYDNVAIALDGPTERHVAQRVPFPGVMWRPWRDENTYRAHVWETGVLQARDRKLGVLLCYEQMLVFPVLWSVLGGADTLVGMSNLRAFPSPPIARWQDAALLSWSALFALPSVMALNR